MTCPVCIRWCASTPEMLEHRRGRVQQYGDLAKAHNCPSCGGTDWLLSAEAIREPDSPERWYHFSFWEGVSAVLLVLCMLCALWVGLWLR